jgi:alkylhydroperoxidase family enzyme
MVNLLRCCHLSSTGNTSGRAMAAHQALYVSAMAGTKTLRKVEREMIAMVVSAINECHY